MTSKPGVPFHVVQVEGARVIEFGDAVHLDNATVDNVRSRLFELVDGEGDWGLILDFANVRALSSAALGMLVTLALKGVRLGRRLALCAVQPSLSEVLYVLQLDRFFEICESRVAAEERFRRTPRPSNEKERLAVLRSLYILDTPPEESFDRIVRLAARIFAAPIAQVSLVDEHREWFKARCGTTATGGPRSAAFCTHTILSKEILIVPDARVDDRFRNNALVTQEGIRFYAGAPLTTAAGLNLGALCIKDRVPREFSDEQAEILCELAALVVERIESRLIGIQSKTPLKPT